MLPSPVLSGRLWARRLLALTCMLLGACAVAPVETTPVYIPVFVPVPVEQPPHQPPGGVPGQGPEPVPGHGTGLESPHRPHFPYRPPVVQGPLVCSVGQQACRGPYGSQCYSPSRGERCTQGAVCGPAQEACLGPYGAACYTPSRGERCQQGAVCEPGQQVCVRGGRARCFSPSRGETCR